MLFRDFISLLISILATHHVCGVIAGGRPTGSSSNNNLRTEQVATSRGRDLEYKSYNCADGNDPCIADDWDGHSDGYFFPHDDGQMYVTCDSWGTCYDMACPTGTVWNQDITSCVHDCDTGSCRNPCTADAIDNGEFYHTFCENDKMFVQCDEWGGCFVSDCAPGTVWSQEAQTCVNDCRPALGSCLNPCNPTNIGTNGLYHALCDDETMFVQCDSAIPGCFVMPCGEDQIWDYQDKMCVHDPNKAVIAPDSGVGVVVTCENGRVYSHDFQGCVKVCDVPEDVENPCTKTNIDIGDMYHEHWSDNERKFVMCDEGGGCTVERCKGGQIWNQRKEKCVSEEYTGCERDASDWSGSGTSEDAERKSKTTKSTKASRVDWQKGCENSSSRSGKGKGGSGKSKGKGGSGKSKGKGGNSKSKGKGGSSKSTSRRQLY